MPATLRGIYHNLRESTYVVSNSEITFFFSSELYLNKFIDGYKAHRLLFLDKLAKNVVDTTLNMETLADISYYKSIEKRGFYAWLKGVDMTWEEIQKYALRKMTEPNTLDWLRIPRLKLEERIRIME